MPERTQDIKNLRAVATACKNYTDKKIDDLRWELGTYDLSVESDNTSALVKTMPSGTIKLNVNKIDGASEVSENLIVLQDVVETTTNGITYSVSNGVLKINGTATASFGIYINANIIPLGTYTMGAFNDKVVSGSYGIYLRNSVTSTNIPLSLLQTVNSSYTVTTTIECNQLHLWLNTNASFDNITIKPMLVSGSTAPTTFKQGFSGIHNIELTGIKSEGANLCNNVNANLTVSNGILIESAVSTNYIIPVIEGQNYTITRWTNNGNRYNIGLAVSNTVGSLCYENYSYTSGTIGTGVTITIPNGYHYIVLYIANSIVNEDVSVLICSTSPTAYVPYITPTTLPIDLTSILYNGSPLFEENSIKAVGTAKDYIMPYKAHKQMGSYTFTGNETWTRVGTSYGTSVLDGLVKYLSDNNQIINALIVGFTPDTANNVYAGTTNNTISGISASNPNRIRIYSSSIDSQTDAQNATRGKTIVFELATPIDVDIDFSFLKNIDGYSNGSITLTNTCNMATTSEIDYLIEEVKA